MPSSQSLDPFDDLPSDDPLKLDPLVRAQWESDRKNRVLRSTVTGSCGHEKVVEIRWENLRNIDQAERVAILTRMRSTRCYKCVVEAETKEKK